MADTRSEQGVLDAALREVQAQLKSVTADRDALDMKISNLQAMEKGLQNSIRILHEKR